MSTKFITYDKLSKKAKKERNNAKRVTWDCNPVTKIVKSKKTYSRKVKHKSANGYDDNYR